jgi:hypothetical protein
MAKPKMTLGRRISKRMEDSVEILLSKMREIRVLMGIFLGPTHKENNPIPKRNPDRTKTQINQ